MVETLVCVAILALGLTFVLNAFTSEINALRTSRNYTRAGILLEEKFCDLEKEGEIDINTLTRSGDFSIAYNTSGSSSNTVEPDPEREKFKWEITEIKLLKDESNNDLGIFEVTVFVWWKELGLRRELGTTAYLRRKP